jgi:AmmeMemoRadiSam system protein B
MVRATAANIREPAVAGSFYPDDPRRLRALAVRQLGEASARFPPPSAPGLGEVAGILVPHAGLEYSGVVAAAAWRLLGSRADTSPAPPTVVILGTNHRALWLEGIGAWDRGAWRTPLAESAVDADLAAEVVALGRPYTIDLDAHRGEHSIEVQLPFLQAVVPAARIAPLAVAMGTGSAALEAGARLGSLLAARRKGGSVVLLAISTDMAHYPQHRDAEWVTEQLVPAILALDGEALAAQERDLRRRGVPNLACGMCGIEPAVVGLAALRAAGARRGVALASATSADAGGPDAQTVGYLAVAFD